MASTAPPHAVAPATTAEFTARITFSTDHRNPTRFVWSHILRHPLFGVLMIIGAFSNAALAVVVPALIGLSFDAVLAGEPISVIGTYALLIIGSQLLRGALQFARNGSAELFAQRVERDVRDELYANLLGKSMTFHAMQPVGDIMARVTNDVREMNLMMNPGLNLTIGSGMFLLTPVLAAVTLHPALVIIPLAFNIWYAFFQIGYLRRLTPVTRAVRETFGTMNSDVAEALDGLQVVKGSAQEGREREKFDRLSDEVAANQIKQGVVEANYVPMLMLGLVVFAAFAHSAVLYVQGVIPIGTVVAYLGQIALFGFPIFTSQYSFGQLASGYASAQRILSIINTTNDLDQNTSGHQKPIAGAIVFENVSFGYRDDAGRVLHDISFRVEPGQTVAIVGQTGSGKTTLTKLINRTYDADAGRVLVDGVDVREWSLEALRSQISIIEQDIFLFSRSIADNIRFGKPDATQEAIETAARQAQAHEFILQMPDGYETVVGQRGVTLSGGQRQRLALARAFVTDPPILVLDDSTSAIDSATEDKIQQAIWAAARGRTTILITHRLSQIRWADWIVVIKNGRVVAQGKHEDLLTTSEPYTRIFARYDSAPTNDHQTTPVNTSTTTGD